METTPSSNHTSLSKSSIIITAIALIGFGYMIARFTPTNQTADTLTTTGGKAAVGTTQETKTQPTIVFNPITEKDHIKGNPETAEVTIIEYSDLECPYCKIFHNTLTTVVDSYNGKVAWVYRHFPIDSLHPKARKQAEATECAYEQGGNEAFWKYTDKVFALTPSNNGLAMELLSYIAEKNGLDVKKFDECLASGRYAGKIQAMIDDGNRAGVAGTPHSILVAKNGKVVPLSGSYNAEQLTAQIDIIMK